MEFILGALTMLCLFEGYLLYKRPKHNTEEIDEREREEQRRREEHLQALLNYDVDMEYKGGRR